MKQKIEQSEKIIKQLYDDDYKMTTTDGKEFIIPPEGNLGLLALGHKGLIAVRKKRKEINWKNPNSLLDEKK